MAEMFYLDDLFGIDDEEPEDDDEEPSNDKPKNFCDCGAFYGSFPTLKESHMTNCPMYKDDYFREDRYKQWKREYKIWEKNNS